MVDSDLVYIRKLIQDKIIAGPVLELGTGYGGATTRGEFYAANLQYYGTDLNPGSGVDFVADFERSEQMEVFNLVKPFGCVLILNVLEHTFDPIRVLDNARSLVGERGVIVVLTPSIWPLHNYPMDAWRILPNFYEEYAKRRGLELMQDYFQYVGFGRVDKFKGSDGVSYTYPPPAQAGLRYWYGKLVHRIFNTYGRSMFHPSHVAVAATFRVEKNSVRN